MLNRGNHESGNQNMTGGFMMEVLDKYSYAPPAGPSPRHAAGGGAVSTASGGTDPEMGLRMYDLFQAAFDCMPLAHVVATGSSSSGDVIASDAASAGSLPAGSSPRGAAATSSSSSNSSKGAAAAASSSSARRVFVTHGGLMQRPGIRMEHIASIKRKREIPYGLPGFEDKLFEDLMWSDPRVMEGHCPSDRGAGVFFGPDVTERFCALNGVSLVVRSHECVPEGFLFMHRDHLLTVFSASRYCGRGTNRGAFMVLEDDLSLTVQQYVAGTLASTDPCRGARAAASSGATAAGADVTMANAAAFERDYGLATAVAHGALPQPVTSSGGQQQQQQPQGPGLVVMRHVGADGAEAEDAALAAAQEEAVRAMLVERICLHKSELYFFWTRMDDVSRRDGTITLQQWADGMRTVLNLDLPWAAMGPVLQLDEGQGGGINYSRFLERFRIEMRDSDAAWMEGIVGAICRKMAAVFPSLESAFGALDKDGSGELGAWRSTPYSRSRFARPPFPLLCLPCATSLSLFD